MDEGPTSSLVVQPRQMDTKLEGTRLSRNKLWHVAMKDGRPRIIRKKGKSTETLIRKGENEE